MASSPIFTKLAIFAVAVVALIQLQIAGSIRLPPSDSQRSARDSRSAASDELKIFPLTGLQLGDKLNTDDAGTDSPISTQIDRHVADLTQNLLAVSSPPPHVLWKLHTQSLPNKYPPPPGGNPTHG